MADPYILCPGTQQPCRREVEWGHPCDRDENGDRTTECERLNERPEHG